MIRRLTGRERARNGAAVGTRRGAVRARCVASTGCEAVQGCRGRQLYRAATQAVFGEGDSNARWYLSESSRATRRTARVALSSVPRRILDSALEDAGIARSQTYVTNAVKHFKFRRAEGGKRSDPSISEPDRDSRVPTVVGGRVARARPRRARVPGSDCRQGGVRTVLQVRQSSGGSHCRAHQSGLETAWWLSQRFIRPLCCAPGSRTTCMRDWSQTSGSSPQNWHDFGSSPGQRGIPQACSGPTGHRLPPMAAAVIRAR